MLMERKSKPCCSGCWQDGTHIHTDGCERPLVEAGLSPLTIVRGSPSARAWMLDAVKVRLGKAVANAARLRAAYCVSTYAQACELLARLDDEMVARCEALIRDLS